MTTTTPEEPSRMSWSTRDIRVASLIDGDIIRWEDAWHCVLGMWSQRDYPTDREMQGLLPAEVVQKIKVCLAPSKAHNQFLIVLWLNTRPAADGVVPEQSTVVTAMWFDLVTVQTSDSPS